MPKENKKINSPRKKIVKKRGPRKSTAKKKVVSKKAVQKKKEYGVCEIQQPNGKEVGESNMQLTTHQIE